MGARLKSKLPRAAAASRWATHLAVAKVAHDIEAQAKMNAPVDTGNLRNSIRTQLVSPLEARVEVGAEYGPYVEYGTRHMGAQPFLTPAAELVASRLPDVFATHFGSMRL